MCIYPITFKPHDFSCLRTKPQFSYWLLDLFPPSIENTAQFLVPLSSIEELMTLHTVVRSAPKNFDFPLTIFALYFLAFPEIFSAVNYVKNTKIL